MKVSRVKRASGGSARLIEPLESRTLLSATPLPNHEHAAAHHQAEQKHSLHQHVNLNLKVLSENKTLKPAASSGSVYYTPAQIRHAYGFDLLNSSTTGLGQTIAVVDAYRDTHVGNDLSTFDSTFGLPSATLQVVQMSHYESTDSGWGLETALDVEWAHAIAPGAKLLLVEARSASLGDLLNAVNYAKQQPGVSAVSMSWGGSEFSSESSYDSYFVQPHVTFVASAGDSGGVQEWPAESPNVLSIGGTSLYLDASGNYSSESAWSSGGGGVSAYEAEPSYQRSVQATGARTNPDVSYNADSNTGYYVYDSNYYGSAGWFGVGGTSAGAPQWSAMIALANQQRANAGKSALSGSQTLAALYTASQVPTSAYHDVTNGSAGSNQAKPGYDLATGQGSPFSNQVISDLTNNV